MNYLCDKRLVNTKVNIFKSNAGRFNDFFTHGLSWGMNCLSGKVARISYYNLPVGRDKSANTSVERI